MANMYRIRYGKFGPYFVSTDPDEIDDIELSLDDVLDLLNKHATSSKKSQERFYGSHNGEVCDFITDSEIKRVHANADFGSYSKRSIVNLGVLKCASGYHQGYTSNQIAIEHGLVTEDYKLTEKGRKYLWAAFGYRSNF